MNHKVILILSLLVGMLAFGLSIRYFHSRMADIERARAEFEQRVRKVEVVVAAQDIPQGMTLDKKDVARGRIFEIEISAREDVVTAQDAPFVLGRKTLFSLQRGDPLYWSFFEGGGRTGPSLATAVTPGLRAVSLSIAGAASVSSMVAPNDRVDVLGTFTLPSTTVAETMETVTLTVLQDVTVLATGQRLANESAAQQRSARQNAYSTVTLEVTPREAELLVFAQQLKGGLFLALRNPSDLSFEKDLPSINFQRLQDALPELNQSRQRNIRHKPTP